MILAEELATWKITDGFRSTYTSYCGPYHMVGGYMAFGAKSKMTKTFENLPPHHKLNIRVLAFLLLSWDSEVFTVFVDGKRVRAYRSQHTENPFHWCGPHQQWRSKTEYVDFSVYHTSGSATIAFSSTLDQNPDDEAWGIRNFVLSTEMCNGNCAVVTEEFMEDTFEEGEIVDWNFDKEYPTKITKCDKTIVGGYKVFGKTKLTKKFSGLPTHTKVIINLKMYFIDSWDNERFVVSSGRNTNEVNTKANNGDNTNVCGGTYKNDDVRMMSIELAHNEADLEISLQDYLDEKPDNESWGFREFSVFIEGCGDKEGCNVVSQELFDSFDSSAVKGWTIGDAEYNTVTKCKDENVLGGYKALSTKSIEKNFNNLPGHSSLILNFRMFQLDSWDEPVYIEVDGIRRLTITK